MIARCPRRPPRAASSSSSRSPGAAATSTRSTTRAAGCSSTGGCSPPPPTRPTTASSPTRSAATATRSSAGAARGPRVPGRVGRGAAGRRAVHAATRPARTPSSSACRPRSRAGPTSHDLDDLTPAAAGRDPALLRGLQGARAGQVLARRSGIGGREAAWREIEEARANYRLPLIGGPTSRLVRSVVDRSSGGADGTGPLVPVGERDLRRGCAGSGW